jgi:hypothetical protein
MFSGYLPIFPLETCPHHPVAAPALRESNHPIIIRFFRPNHPIRPEILKPLPTGTASFLLPRLVGELATAFRTRA